MTMSNRVPGLALDNNVCFKFKRPSVVLRPVAALVGLSRRYIRVENYFDTRRKKRRQVAALQIMVAGRS